MSDKQIVIFPRGQLTIKDRKRMEANNFVVVEADDPDKVVTAIPGCAIVSADDLLMAAMKGATESYASMAEFAKELHRRLKAREQQS